MAFSAVRGGDLSWVAMAQSAPLLAWALLWGNLFWVLAYDTEYAMVDRDDDLRIGMKTSAITLGQHDVRAVAGFYVLYLLSWWGLLRDEQLGWPFMLGLLGAALQALWHVRLIRGRQREACFLAFRVNHWLGATVFAGVVAGYALRG
jgi:4-hydroxybenzoate polyprenyltransferase